MATSVEPVPKVAQKTSQLLLEKRLDEIGPMFRAAWDLYIKFYTVFLMFSLGAMGWVIEHKTERHELMAGAFIGQTFLTLGTNVGMALYTYRTKRNHEELEAELAGDDAVPTAEVIPIALGIWAGTANALGMAGLIWVWFRIGFGK
ncbi:MAG TPA: hypothetical protein VMI06_09905 [Terriglobia bacterium]|nr:hypothetical protein [Terriglobia bacterium]HTW80613.1 hypothetical protein [Terracidiphilus sp.]